MSEPTKIGRYEIKSKLGEGGMGEVFLGHDADLNRDVAIKVLLPEFCCDLERVSRFKLEAKAVSALNHPNIITIYEIRSEDDSLYIVTECVKGETLRSLIQNGKLTVETALDYAQQIASALAATHKNGIIHRDIKPENIMVREDGIVKVLDFGLAKPRRIAAEEKTLELVKTKAGLVMGSVGYMSPEQARGKEVDERTDLWSLGVVLYEMLTGKAPFDGETTTDILANIIHKEPEPIDNYLKSTPKDLAALINKALRKNTDERYQNAPDFVSDLKSLRRDLGADQVDGFLTAQIARTSSPTTAIKLNNTEDTKTLLHHSVSADSLGKTVTNPGLQTKRRNWWIPVGIVGLGCLIALGAWLFSLPSNISPSFNSMEISTVAGSEKAFGPTISRDGKYLGYINYENGAKSLVIRQIATGSEMTLVSQVENQGFLQPTFSPDGNYVYYVLADKGVGTLFQVPTLGGTPKQLVNDVDSKVTFSPDGSQIAFRRRDATNGAESIFIANADGTNEKAYVSNKEAEVTGFSEVAWSPSGKSLLVSGAGDYLPEELAKTKVMIVSLEDKSIRKFGDREWFNAGSFNWTADGSSLLMLAKSNNQEPAQIWLVTYPDGEKTRRITNDSSGYQLISYAPEANIITAAKQNTISSLWTYNPTNKELNQITSDNKNLLGATGFDFLPDGKILTSKVDNNKSNLITIGADGKGEKILTNDDSFNGQAVVSTDGRYIVYTSSKDKNLSLWRMDIDGKNPVQLTKSDNGFDSKPQITSDSKTIIFERQNPDFSKSTLMKISIEGGNPTEFIADEKKRIMLPQLSDDGKLLVYSTLSFDKTNTRFDRSVIVQALNNSEIKDIKREFTTSLGNNYRFTPDGKYLSYINLTGVSNIFNIPLDGSEPKQITNFNSGHTINFAWSKDGKKLFVVRAIINSEVILMKNNVQG